MPSTSQISNSIKEGENQQDIISNVRDIMTSQPFDKDLHLYKKTLVPKDKIGFDKQLGAYGYYILDWHKGEYAYISKGIEEMTGYYQCFLDRGVQAFWELLHPEDVEALSKIHSLFMEMAEGMSEEEFNAYSFNFDYRLKKRSGGYVNILQQVLYTSFDKEGNIVYDAGIGFDISRYRNDGNKSLSIVNRENGKIREYYPKEESFPKIGEVRKHIAELNHALGQSNHSLLRNVKQEILDNLDRESFDVSKICEALNISRAHLYKEIKSLANTTPNRLIKLHRLKRALELLANRELQISEIAYRVGFSSASYFTKCFREEFDITPSEYRKRILQ